MKKINHLRQIFLFWNKLKYYIRSIEKAWLIELGIKSESQKGLNFCFKILNPQTFAVVLDKGATDVLLSLLAQCILPVTLHVVNGYSAHSLCSLESQWRKKKYRTELNALSGRKCVRTYTHINPNILFLFIKK